VICKLLSCSNHLWKMRTEFWFGSPTGTEIVEVFCKGWILTRQTKYIWRNIEPRSRKHCCCGKAVIVSYYRCVFVALGIQHAKRMSGIILLSVACQTVPCFSTLSYKSLDFRGKEVTKHKMCVLIFSTTFVRNLSHSKKNWARYYQKYVLLFM